MERRNLRLLLGAAQIDRWVDGADLLLKAYGTDIGLRYLDYQPTTDADQLRPEDLAVTILMNSRFGYRAFESVQDRALEVNLASLPNRALEDTTQAERRQLADLIAHLAGWSGFAASLATKLLHKKRPG